MAAETAWLSGHLEQLDGPGLDAPVLDAPVLDARVLDAPEIEPDGQRRVRE